MDTEQVVQNLIAQNRAQAKEIEDLKIRNNTLQATVEHYRSRLFDYDEENVPGQYTWDEAEKQFKVDL